MKPRDRLVVMVVGALVVLLAGWVVWVKPERKQASSLNAQVASAQAAVSSARVSLELAEADKAAYPAAYASMLSLGEAVPATPDVPALVYELDRAADAKDVTFTSITAGGSTAATTTDPTTGVVSSATDAFTTLPFTFEFKGTYFQLYNLLDRIDGFAEQTRNGSFSVTGRLLTIQSLDLTAETHGDERDRRRDRCDPGRSCRRDNVDSLHGGERRHHPTIVLSEQ
jgi:Tfp pilus assembly protein PilO